MEIGYNDISACLQCEKMAGQPILLALYITKRYDHHYQSTRGLVLSFLHLQLCIWWKNCWCLYAISSTPVPVVNCLLFI